MGKRKKVCRLHWIPRHDRLSVTKPRLRLRYYGSRPILGTASAFMEVTEILLAYGGCSLVGLLKTASARQLEGIFQQPRLHSALRTINAMRSAKRSLKGLHDRCLMRHLRRHTNPPARSALTTAKRKVVRSAKKVIEGTQRQMPHARNLRCHTVRLRNKCTTMNYMPRQQYLSGGNATTDHSCIPCRTKSRRRALQENCRLPQRNRAGTET